MAAVETPWLSQPGNDLMSSRDDSDVGGSAPIDPQTGVPLTYAAFSPVTLQANTPSRSARRSTVLVHQKSPLLLATPPQVTRALAYSHPFLLPLNTVVGLLTWSTGDSWQSFLLLCSFWGVVLYGDFIIQWAGPVAVAFGLIVGMYGRRYSPLSSSGWTETREAADPASKPTSQPGPGGQKGNANEKGAKHQRAASELTSTKHQKTLDEIVETLKEFTGRCNVLMDPLLEMTDFLSTQQTPTSATTKPALTAMFMRLLIVTPFWIALTLPPLRIITLRRVALVAGSVVLTWHSRAMRVTRAILWRSAAIRRLAAVVTGLRFDSPAFSSHHDAQGKDWRVHDPTIRAQESELTKALKRPQGLNLTHRRTASGTSSGVKFTFIIYENQRRWVGLGWTNSLFAYERSAWTDEHNNEVPPKDEFELPEVEDGSNMKWRWARESRWRVDGAPDEQSVIDYEGGEGKNGWIFYDNKWQNGRRGQDGWGRWTRRRKWYRDAELVEVSDMEMLQRGRPSPSAAKSYTSAADEKKNKKMASTSSSPTRSDTISLLPSIEKTFLDLPADDDAASVLSTSTSSRTNFFWPTSLRKRMSGQAASPGGGAEKEKEKMKGGRNRRPSESVSIQDDGRDDTSTLGMEVRSELQRDGKGSEWGIGDEARMSLE